MYIMKEILDYIVLLLVYWRYIILYEQYVLLCCVEGYLTILDLILVSVFDTLHHFYYCYCCCSKNTTPTTTTTLVGSKMLQIRQH
jgi:hypothetical protein